ncbi:hypothetical protein OUZ56_026890 [Daphnia magna]|uniref:Uncharacterized protein n=1 Tax=Daphnia magna TaxID=35525 RepID=A0ABQ9ZPH5_9CRUS|nr:hypothetical protein OUZ56_026890 [Daphnia magna]
MRNLVVLKFPRGRRGDRLLQNLQYCCNVTFHLIKIVFHSSCWTTIILLGFDRETARIFHKLIMWNVEDKWKHHV